MAVTAKPLLPREDADTRGTEEDAMPRGAFGAHNRAYRLYDVELPYHVPGLGVGIAISKFKQIGVWDKFPHSLKDKAKAARGSWSGLKITQKDLDSIPDDAWERIAAELRVGWRYASNECGRVSVAAHAWRAGSHTVGREDNRQAME